jgi:uracil-DNA glycosylase family 4
MATSLALKSQEPPLPDRDCPFCPRLVAFRLENRAKFPDWHNAPVPPFGGIDAKLLIVGLAPGLRGANRTARPFTGDFAGVLLYQTLLKFGLAQGSYGQSPDDGLKLIGARITNAVRCVPPQNKPEPSEFTNCRPFLVGEIAAMKNLKVIVALGKGAHDQVLRTLNARPAKDFPFIHAAQHRLPNGLLLADSYHCSRYNTNTGVLTTEMFERVFAQLKPVLG